MTNWLSPADIADILGLQPHDVLEGLAKLHLAEGSHPTDLAERHTLAGTFFESGRPQTLWHPDTLDLLEGIGMRASAPGFRTLDSDFYYADDLFGEELGLEVGLASDTEGAAAVQPLAAQGPSTVKAPIGTADAQPVTGEGTGPIGKIKLGYAAVVATDGACSGNPGPGGWAWVEQVSGARSSGGAARTTNNIMELTALIEGLEYVGPAPDLLIRCDSQYVINTVTKWAPAWRRKGWKKSDGKPVKNRELVERLLNLYENRTGRTDVEWVKGHAGDQANELCDSLAVAASRKYGK